MRYFLESLQGLDESISEIDIRVDTYKTIDISAEGFYKDKGSKFLSFVHHVESIEEAMTFLADYRRKYYDARHICYAYMIGTSHDTFRVNDDSEPSGTAGRPILGQINSASLTNVLVVVVRYFGGILLGTSGLIAAYKGAAADAIANAQIVERLIVGRVEVRYGYSEMSYVMHVVKELQAQILYQQQLEQCVLQVSIRQDMVQNFLSRLIDVKGITTKIL